MTRVKTKQARKGIRASVNGRVPAVLMGSVVPFQPGLRGMHPFPEHFLRGLNPGSEPMFAIGHRRERTQTQSGDPRRLHLLVSASAGDLRWLGTLLPFSSGNAHSKRVLSPQPGSLPVDKIATWAFPRSYRHPVGVTESSSCPRRDSHPGCGRGYGEAAVDRPVCPWHAVHERLRGTTPGPCCFIFSKRLSEKVYINATCHLFQKPSLRSEASAGHPLNTTGVIKQNVKN